MITTPVNAIRNFTYFCMNFNPTFIKKCWADKPNDVNHLEHKFNEVYKRRGTAVIPFFMIFPSE